MNTLIESVLRTFIAARRDLFDQDASFLRFKLDPRFNACDGYNSNLQFGRIVCANDGERESPPLALKLSPEQASFPELQMFAFTNEIFFYTQTLPFFSSLRNLDHLFPKYYDSQLNVNANVFKAAIIFENLQAGSFMMSSKKSFLDYDHLSLMLRKLGEFHAYSYATKNRRPAHFRLLASSFTETHCTLNWRLDVHRMFPAAVSRGLRGLQDDPVYSSKAKELEKFVQTCDLTEFVMQILLGDRTNPVAVLCHGGYSRHNVLFKYEQQKPVDLKMIDMATCRLASPVIDLAIVLYVNADQEMRTAHWDDLLDEYYDALRETFPLNEVPSKDTIKNEFRTKSFYAYFVAAYFLNGLIAADHNLPKYNDLLPAEYKGMVYGQLPSEINIQTCNELGGELATEALSNIIKDMLDRGFM